jgi:hypothetical protein
MYLLHDKLFQKDLFSRWATPRASPVITSTAVWATPRASPDEIRHCGNDEEALYLYVLDYEDGPYMLSHYGLYIYIDGQVEERMR